MSGELAKALALAQGEFKDPAKSKTGQVKGRSGYRYAGLDDVLQAVRPVLAKHGLAVAQLVDVQGDVVGLRTVLLHGSGEQLASFYPLGWGGTSQDHGSELTYARRYSLEALLGVSATDDDDGASASTTPPAPKPRKAYKDESPEEKTERRATHDPSWENGGRARFMGGLAQLGWDYEVVADFCEMKGWPRPSAAGMSDARRQKLLDLLVEGDVAVELVEYLDRREGSVPAEEGG